MNRINYFFSTPVYNLAFENKCDYFIIDQRQKPGVLNWKGRTTLKQTMNNSKVSIRLALPVDLTEMQKMYVDTISTICKNDYSPEEIKSWTSSSENKQRWTDRITLQYFLVAELEGTIVGFASLENNDYIDFLYVHKDFQRQGIANELYSELETEAVNRKALTLYSDVSKTAKPFFEKKKFIMLHEQKNKKQGIQIINYKMKKEL